MPLSRKLSLALGLALAVPAAAYASPLSHHHHGRAYHGTVVHRVAAPAASLASVQTFGFWPSSYTPSHRQYEIEGLTRNPDDCVRYGCLGAN